MAAKRNCPCSTWNMGGGGFFLLCKEGREETPNKNRHGPKTMPVWGKMGDGNGDVKNGGVCTGVAGSFRGTRPRTGAARLHGGAKAPTLRFPREGVFPWWPVPAWRVAFFGDPPTARPGKIARRGQGARPAVPTGEVFPCRPVPRGICLPATRNQRDKCLEFLCLLSL